MVNDMNLALKLAKAEWGRVEQKGEESAGKNQVNSEKNMPRKTEFAMKQITIPIGRLSMSPN